jgi:hypothetical protein
MVQFGLLPNDMAKEVVLASFEHFKDWPITSAEAFRNALLGVNSMIAVNPILDIHEPAAAKFLQTTIETTVKEGRMIDFGFIPNEVFRIESARSQDLYIEGAFTHPFGDWLGVTSWEGGSNAYHVSPHPDFANQVLVLELYGVKIPPNQIIYRGVDYGGFSVIVIYDVTSIYISPEGIMVAPYHALDERSNVKPEAIRRGANALEPLITMLRILADASIPVVYSPAPMKLNKIRAKKGEPEIPEHTIVKTADYVSSFHAAKATAVRISKGGHHASPTPHWRRSHPRTLANGRVVKVKEAKVNWRDGEELHRLFYKVNKPFLVMEKPNDQVDKGPEQGRGDHDHLR